MVLTATPSRMNPSPAEDTRKGAPSRPPQPPRAFLAEVSVQVEAPRHIVMWNWASRRRHSRGHGKPYCPHPTGSLTGMWG